MRNKKLKFRYLIEKVQERLKGWSRKIYSAGEKEILIKSVIQSIPTYVMACFRIPKLICDEIEKV